MDKPVELELLETLEDLTDEQLKYFQWYLQKVQLLDGFPAIKKCHLEKADRLKTVDLMVHIYSKDTMEVTRMIFKKIKEGLGKTRRKMSDSDASLIPSTNTEYPSISSTGGPEHIYDLGIPAVVKFAYTAEHEDELTLVKGSQVIVMEKYSHGWWRGSSGERVGWFPSNYVLEENNMVRGAMTISNKQTLSSHVLHTIQTLYPFSSTTKDELSFDMGEVMEVIEKPQSDRGWWRCRNSRGMVGLVPRNYVVILSDSLSPILQTTPAHKSDACSSAVVHKRQGQQFEPQFLLATCQNQDTEPLTSSTLNGSCPKQHAINKVFKNKKNNKLIGKEWYFGTMTRKQANQELGERGEEGDFLVRCSESSPDTFSISLRDKTGIKHYKVQLLNGTFSIGQRCFSSMDELVEYYKRMPLCGGDNVRLYLVRPLSVSTDPGL